MSRPRRWMVLAVVLVACSVGACTRTPVEDARDSTVEVRPVRERSEGRVALTAEAAQRVGIQTAAVREAPVQGKRQGYTVIPYAAVLYDPAGQTWTYVNSEPLVFVRHPIEVVDIRADLAFLSSGPPVGTQVVTVGASELLGSEYEVGEE
jgi:hypothetical protein